MKFGEQTLRGWVREDVEASSEEYFQQRLSVKNTQNETPAKNTQNKDSSEEYYKDFNYLALASFQNLLIVSVINR